MSLSANNLPLVSVYVPAYNHERYVQEAIQSIIDQDYPRIELIVTDDGSTDGTWQKIEEMRAACERRFERVVMRTRENKGRVVTALENLALVKGEFVAGIASDDRYLPGALTKLIKPMLEDETIGLTVGRNIIIDSHGVQCYWDANRNIVYDRTSARFHDFDEFLEYDTRVDLKGKAFGTYREITMHNHIGNGQLRRRCMYATIVPYDNKAPLEDWWFHLQFSKVAKYKYVDEETFCYRWHGCNTVTNTEYMREIGRQTLIRELELLNARHDEQHLTECSFHLPVSEIICSFSAIRRTFSIVRECYLRHCRYRIKISTRQYVLPWRFKYHA